MKKLWFTFLLVLTTLTTFAQGNTIKFLGIPIDGRKSQMVSALKNKGFVYDTDRKDLLGKFNGVSSVVIVSENRGKVDRIIVVDKNPSNEADIKIRYNNLISQFDELSEKYYTITPNMLIPDDEDISYEMNVHSKRYEAIFYYYPFESDSEIAMQVVEEATNEIKESLTEDELTKIPEEQLIVKTLALIAQKTFRMTTGHVWFMITEKFGGYRLAIYYENDKNRPNGEDL